MDSDARVRRVSSQGGFSLIEVLVAALILAVILLGLLPLFTRSMVENAAGHSAGDQANLGRSHLEQLIQLPFGHDDLEIDAGVEAVDTRFLASNSDVRGDETWEAPSAIDPTDDTALWQRTTTVRQYAIHGVQDTDGDGVVDVILGLEDDDGDGVPDAALDASTLPGGIHVKGLGVRLDSEIEGGPLRAPAAVRLQALKAF